MVIDFSKIDLKDKPMLVLRNLDSTAIQTLGNAFNINCELFFNEVSKITFDLPAYADGSKTPGYDDVIGTRIVDLVGIGQFILMNPQISSDGIREIKSCTAYSLEYELTYKKLSISEGTYSFYNPAAPDGTIIDIILSYLPSWSIGEIDEKLIGKYRTFSVDNENIYDFIKSTLQKTYGCIFDFDTYERKINVRSVQSEAEKSPVYISLNNLAKEIDVSEDTENIITVLDVNGADGVDIRSVNPTGENKIYNLDYYMNTSHFSEDIIEKWQEYKKGFSENQPEYYAITVQKVIKTSAILTEENKLYELKNVKLAKLENNRSNIIEYLASVSNTSSDSYNTKKKELNKLNEKISEVNEEINNCNSVIERLTSEKNALGERLAEINSQTKLSNYFSEDKLVILDRYFREDAIEESSFVVSAAESYTDAGSSKALESVEIKFEGGEISTLGDIFTVSGGSITVGGLISANIVKASLEVNDDGTFVLSAYLGKGEISKSEFTNGCISLTGDSGIIKAEEDGLSFDAENAYVYFTKNTTEYEKFSVEWELYEYGCECLKKLAYPSYSFSVSAANFLALDEFSSFVRKLFLGNKVYIEMTDEKVLKPIFVGLSFSFDDPSSLKLEFGDTYNLSDSSFSLVDLLEKSVSMGKTVDTSRFSYNSFIESGASTAVKDFMNSTLDVAKNAIMSGENMAITWDSSGIHCRKRTDSGFAPEEIAVINNSIVFTNDSWQSAKMAIGQFYDTNCKTDENETGEVWGIVAPNIVGTLLAGENLVIESTKPDGEHMSFKVDGSGASLYNASFDIVKNNNHIALNPDIGFAIGTYPVVNEDGVDRENAKFWVDADGNVRFRGILEGAGGTFSGELQAVTGTFSGEINVGDGNFVVDSNGYLTAKSGEFSGTVQAEDFLDNKGKSMLKNGYKFASDYLDLKGLTVSNADGPTFKVTNDGDVKIKGELIGCNGTFSGTLQSPKIYSSNFSVFPEGSASLPDSYYTGFNLYDNFGGRETHYLNISALNPHILIYSPDNMIPLWSFNETHFCGLIKFIDTVDFDGATVKNLHATFA